MKKILTLYLICCTIISKADYWTQKADFPLLGREYPFSFSVGNKGYVGCGYDFNNFKQDFWEYDPSINVWTQKANFGGVGRYMATGFSINNKGYAGWGIASGISPFSDFWEYDPLTNIWTQKSNFGIQSRSGAVGFSIGNMGYMATGMFGPGIFNNDLWQYDPIADTWSAKSSLPIGMARYRANCFTILNNAYIACGAGTSGCLSDLWEYDSFADTWAQKANFPSDARNNAAAFSICDKGYFGTGLLANNSVVADFWQYDVLTNTWTQKTSFPGSNRNEPGYFSIGSKGYIGFGVGGIGAGPFYNDFWEYTPDSACATGIEEEFSNFNLQFTISPNPAKDFIIIDYPLLNGKEKINFRITNVTGKIVLQTQLSNSTISLKNLSKGIYFVEASAEKQKAVRKFVKE